MSTDDDLTSTLGLARWVWWHVAVVRWLGGWVLRRSPADCESHLILIDHISNEVVRRRRRELHFRLYATSETSKGIYQMCRKTSQARQKRGRQEEKFAG